VEFPASQRLLPFVGMGIERNAYSYTEDSTAYCHEPYYPDAWRCYQSTDSKMGYGLKPQIGFLYLPEPSLALEFWIEYIHVVSKEMFTRDVGFVHPALGLSWHH
jgi:hypothetical protein